jgi:hypothetical protein
MNSNSTNQHDLVLLQARVDARRADREDAREAQIAHEIAQRVYDRVEELEGLIALVRDQYLDEDTDGWQKVEPLMTEFNLLSELAWPSEGDA